MGVVAGLDGCKNGWIAVYRIDDSSGSYSRIVADLEDLFVAIPDLSVVAIDIPIGLTESGPRQCDVVARRTIGARRSSVFPAPIRAVLDAPTYGDALRISRQCQNRGISKQAFAICPKIEAIDKLLQSNRELRDRVYEVHPEVCFWAWNGEADLKHSKKTPDGHQERLRLVTSHFGEESFNRVRRDHSRGAVADDDILDAFAALWTAERITSGVAVTLPENKPLDSTGLPMRIVY